MSLPTMTREHKTLLRTVRYKEPKFGEPGYGMTQRQLTAARRAFLTEAETVAAAEGLRTQRIGKGSYEEVRVFSV